MSRVKSTNEVASMQVGLDSQWLHIPASSTGLTRIQRRNDGSVVVLIKVIVNTVGSSSPTIIADSVRGTIASLAAAASTGQYPYNLPCDLKSDLTITNAGGHDLTVVYKNR